MQINSNEARVAAEFNGCMSKARPCGPVCRDEEAQPEGRRRGKGGAVKLLVFAALAGAIGFGVKTAANKQR